MKRQVEQCLIRVCLRACLELLLISLPSLVILWVTPNHDIVKGLTVGCLVITVPFNLLIGAARIASHFRKYKQDFLSQWLIEEGHLVLQCGRSKKSIALDKVAEVLELSDGSLCVLGEGKGLLIPSSKLSEVMRKHLSGVAKEANRLQVTEEQVWALINCRKGLEKKFLAFVFGICLTSWSILALAYYCHPVASGLAQVLFLGCAAFWGKIGEALDESLEETDWYRLCLLAQVANGAILKDFLEYLLSPLALLTWESGQAHVTSKMELAIYGLKRALAHLTKESYLKIPEPWRWRLLYVPDEALWLTAARLMVEFGTAKDLCRLKRMLAPTQFLGNPVLAQWKGGVPAAKRVADELLAQIAAQERERQSQTSTLLRAVGDNQNLLRPSEGEARYAEEKGNILLRVAYDEPEEGSSRSVNGGSVVADGSSHEEAGS
jgi:hypothetical protein